MTPDPTSLDFLNDIVVPDPVAWWPLAPGWYVVLLALLFAALGIGLRFMQQWQNTRYRREALRELETILPTELPALAKRVALSMAPREQVASLTGDDWLQFLDQSGNTNAFTRGPGKNILPLSYSPDTSLEASSLKFSELKNIVRTWIKNSTPLSPNP